MCGKYSRIYNIGICIPPTRYTLHIQAKQKISISIPTPLEQITKCLICAGIKQNMSKAISHSIPLKINSSLTDERFQTKGYYRSEECTLLCKNNEICVECIKLEKTIY